MIEKTTKLHFHCNRFHCSTSYFILSGEDNAQFNCLIFSGGLNFPSQLWSKCEQVLSSCLSRPCVVQSIAESFGRKGNIPSGKHTKKLWKMAIYSEFTH